MRGLCLILALDECLRGIHTCKPKGTLYQGRQLIVRLYKKRPLPQMCRGNRGNSTSHFLCPVLFCFLSLWAGSPLSHTHEPRRERKESDEKAPRKWACLDLCNFFYFSFTWACYKHTVIHTCINFISVWIFKYTVGLVCPKTPKYLHDSTEIDFTGPTALRKNLLCRFWYRQQCGMETLSISIR